MKLHFLLQERRAASTRYRALQYLPGLEACGWQVEHDGVPEGWLARSALFTRASRADLVFVQRRRLPAWQWRLLRSRGAKLVWDVDDAVWLRSSRHPDRSSTTRERRFADSAKQVDLILAGNETIASYARKQHARVRIVPLSFDVAAHPTHEASGAAPAQPTLGWIGGGKSLAFVEPLREALEALGQRHPGLRLAIVSDRGLSFEHLETHFIPWDESTEKAEVARFDVALAPLPDDDWARAKCGTRLLQCMSAGLPCVASPVGVQRDIIQHGENGLLASTPAEWEAAIDALLEDAALRQRLGESARASVARDFSLSDWTRRIDRELRALIQQEA